MDRNIDRRFHLCWAQRIKLKQKFTQWVTHSDSLRTCFKHFKPNYVLNLITVNYCISGCKRQSMHTYCDCAWERHLSMATKRLRWYSRSCVCVSSRWGLAQRGEGLSTSIVGCVWGRWLDWQHVSAENSAESSFWLLNAFNGGFNRGLCVGIALQAPRTSLTSRGSSSCHCYAWRFTLLYICQCGHSCVAIIHKAPVLWGYFKF